MVRWSGCGATFVRRDEEAGRLLVAAAVRNGTVVVQLGAVDEVVSRMRRRGRRAADE
jgi:hypothetical protein